MPRMMTASRPWRCTKCDGTIKQGEKFQIIGGELFCAKCSAPAEKKKIILTRRVIRNDNA